MKMKMEQPKAKRPILTGKGQLVAKRMKALTTPRQIV